MKDEFELLVGPGGSVEGIYQDELADVLGATTKEVKRASLVEWERIDRALNARFPDLEGWAVRSAHKHDLALRIRSTVNAGVGERYTDSIVCSDDPQFAIALFPTREVALRAEVEHFWELLERQCVPAAAAP